MFQISREGIVLAMSFAIGLDLGGSSIKAIAVTMEGELRTEANVPFDAAVRLDWAKCATGIATQFEAELGESASCIGLSAPGLAARDARSIAFMPGRLEGLEGFDWTNHLKRQKQVPVLNDAHAALMGEVWIGAARGQRNVIMLTLGTGVGGAAMVDGHLLKGAIGRAGHLGHNCLQIDGMKDVTGIPGSIEAMIGNYNISERGQGRFPTTHALVKAYEQGDGFAAEVWLKSVRALACSIASYINLFDPDSVIVGGGVSRAGKLLFGPLDKMVREIEWQPGGRAVPIVHARLGELAGAYGAAWNAITLGKCDA